LKLKISQHLETAFNQAAGSLTGKSFNVAVQDRGPEPALAGAIVWQQSFSSVSGPSLWIVAGRDLWEFLGRVTLEAAGIDSITDEDCRSTWQEIVNQTVACVAAGIAADEKNEVTASEGREIDAEPPGLDWVAFSVTVDDGAPLYFKAAWSAELAAAGVPRRDEASVPAVRDDAVSRTFDLLLEVALPVSVSFGKTNLQIREVLKLNTGSIVELDRLVTDPVEVIVNDCVIARGEVVVVDGNYGVRISQLASREDRLRSGLAETLHKSGGRL
jgi:flagellar motor switch protein FliN